MFQTVLEFCCRESLVFLDFFKDIKKHTYAEFLYLFFIVVLANIALLICLTIAITYLTIHFTIKFIYDLVMLIINVHKQPRPTIGDVRNGNYLGSEETDRNPFKDIR